MSDTVIVFVISAGSPALIALTGVLVNRWGFALLNRRLDSRSASKSSKSASLPLIHR